MDDANHLNTLDDLVKTAMEKSRTPGISVAVVSNENIEIRTYGYANKRTKETVTQDTLFELGSMSKAFTGLGILYLEQEGKLKLTDDVKQYIPWLKLNYKGQSSGQIMSGGTPITIENVLYQTTGIPSKTFGNIPKGNTQDMLEKTVRTLVNVDLDFYPGTQFSYATINYDILGLIIQNITKQSYESFIKEKILDPLGLTNTYVKASTSLQSSKMSKGYKTQFLRINQYNAPEYRGNAPAGYIISNAKDMARWMSIQMGDVAITEKYKKIIEKSHMGNTKVPSSGDFYYGSGWNVHIRNEEINHEGSNPNFSSMIRIKDTVGVCVLTNYNSNAPSYIVNNFYNTLNQGEIEKYKKSIYRNIDMMFTVICIGSLIFGIAFLCLLIIAVIDIIMKKRQKVKRKGVRIAGVSIAIPIMVFFGYCIYFLPNILLGRLPWEVVRVWGSKSIVYGSIFGFAAGIIFLLYVLVTFNFPKPREKNYFALIPLSIINGLTSALIIFTINESFNRNLEYSKELLIYFIFALTFFVYTIKLLQGRMIVITNEITYEKRIIMIDKIVHSSFQTIERIGSSRIYACLNNDTRAIAKVPEIIVGFSSNILTLIFCLAYLMSNSSIAFISSVLVISLSCLIGIITSKQASSYWEKNRDIQDVYFGQLSDLVYGFKELVLSQRRRDDFWHEMKKYSRLTAELSKKAAVKFMNLDIYNTLMYNTIFGVVVFVFPLFIIGISVNDLRQTLFMVFYLIGPFGAMMTNIPKITETRVNVKRINQLIKALNETSEGNDEPTDVLSIADHMTIQFEQVGYEYIIKNDITGEAYSEFTLGAIDIDVSTNEITFITGGNGSGKSTLGKLLTGLYAPNNGRILINGKVCTTKELNQCFSAVFSDYYLFRKLYGVDMKSERDFVEALLSLMKIDNKVVIEENGAFESQNLSTGQKKRLAYIVSCLDHKPFILFDEWAAEQDPEFRQFFYTELLPQLKEKGKGVIVITHDDRFFDLADKMIKLERGVIRE